MYNSISTCGVITPTGNRYIVITTDEGQAAVPLAIANKGEQSLRLALAVHGMSAWCPESWKRLVDKLKNQPEFSAGGIIEKVGWNEGAFAMPDGTIYRPPSSPTFPIAFEPCPSRSIARGTLKGWKKRVAKPLTNQPVPMFLIMATFVAPLLRLTERMDNIGFEIVGEKGIGKTTVHKIAASTVSSLGMSDVTSYVSMANSVAASPEVVLGEHSDMPIVIEAVDALPTSGSPRSLEQYHASIVSTLSSGILQSANLGDLSLVHRTVFTLTANRPLSAMLQQPCSDSLITIFVSDDRSFGVFNHLPKGIKDGAAFAQLLLKAAEKHHGHAFRQFVEALVERRATSEKAVRKQIQGWVDECISRLNIDRNNGRAYRRGQAFGLVYAAGRLAKEYGILPDEWKIGSAVKSVFAMQEWSSDAEFQTFSHRLDGLRNDDRIAKVVNRPGIVGGPNS